jgi:Family of unknown function (DUF6655)
LLLNGMVPAYFDSYDSKYAIGDIRDALSRAGALPEPDAKAANIIIEARAGARSIDSADTLIGIPKTGLPIPLASVVPIPELALYKSDKQLAFAKIALLAYANQSREHIFSSGSLAGKSHNTYRKILFISWTSTDIPEKQEKPEKAEEYQCWFPQYDLTNMPSLVSVTNPPPGNATATNMPAINPSTTNSPPPKMNGATNPAGP